MVVDAGKPGQHTWATAAATAAAALVTILLCTVCAHSTICCIRVSCQICAAVWAAAAVFVSLHNSSGLLLCSSRCSQSATCIDSKCSSLGHQSCCRSAMLHGAAGGGVLSQPSLWYSHHTADCWLTSCCCCCCLRQVVYGHLDDPEGQELERGVSYLKLRPGAPASSRTACTDVAALQVTSLLCLLLVCH
jgi:hypothetical protein